MRDPKARDKNLRGRDFSCRDAKRSFLQNFRIVAGLADGRHRGAPFNDGDFYKWIEAVCSVLAVTNDLALSAAVEAAVAVIARAQRADGYLHTPALIAARHGDLSCKSGRQIPNVEEAFNQVALKRGPVVYGLESPDLPPNMRLLNVGLPPNPDLIARYDSRLLEGVAVLEGKALARSSRDWHGQLSSEFAPEKSSPSRSHLFHTLLGATAENQS